MLCDILLHQKKIDKIDCSNIKTINGKEVVEIDASNDGFYIVYSNNKFDVVSKGENHNIIFLRSKKNSEDSIKIKSVFIDGTTGYISFNKIVDNIYASDILYIDRFGWLEENNKVIGIIRPIISTVNNCELITDIRETKIENNKTYSQITNAHITTSVSDTSIKSDVSSSNINSYIKK